MIETVCKRVVVKGRVQGVWFRQSTQRKALSLGVHGWVRNRPDGSVEAQFEGPGDVVDLAIEWAKDGPERARVDTIEVFEAEPAGLGGFEITG